MKKTLFSSPPRGGTPSGAPRVAVLVETATTWGRNVCAGIQQFAARHGPWLVFIEPRGGEERLALPNGWRGDGVIARITSPHLTEELLALQIPAVNVSGIQLSANPFPCVTTDLSASGRMAAEYFLDRGFRSYAYFSLLGLDYVMTHQRAFAEKLKERGHACAVYSVKPRHGAEPDWNLDLTALGGWIRSLPKPVAVLCWNAGSSREVLFACQQAALLVPEEVSILSGSDDDLLCAMAHIPISGIQVPAQQIGYKAAELLDGLLKKGKAKKRPILIPPSGITARRSSDTLALPDAALAKAVSFVRLNATRPIQVADISTHSGLSRRALERKFEAALNRSPASEIRRMRLERARDLLATTDMSIPEVAEQSGFGSPEYLAYIFRKTLGQTPLKYRRFARNR